MRFRTIISIGTLAGLGDIIAHMSSRPDTRLVLASASPRRRRLLALLGLGYDVTAVDTPEDLTGELASRPADLAAALAAEKAVAARDTAARELVAAFDTIVVHGTTLLGKPTDRNDARRMLRELSGGTHEVVTGVALLAPGAETPVTFAVTTPVRMRDLSDADIDRWFDAGEYLGCAGAYNIESHLAEVDADQCFQNVAGLPLCHLYVALCTPPLSELIDRPERPAPRCDAVRGARCLLGPRVVAGAGCKC